MVDGRTEDLRGQLRSCLQRKAASPHSSSSTLTMFFLSDRSGSAGRTKAAILELIQPYFDSLVTTASTSTRRVLEVASGLGEHLKVRLSSPSLALLEDQLAKELIALLVLCRGQPWNHLPTDRVRTSPGRPAEPGLREPVKHRQRTPAERPR